MEFRDRRNRSFDCARDAGGILARGASSRVAFAYRRAPAAALSLALALAAIAVAVPPTARASGPFPVEETFRGTSFGANWRHGGSAELTAAKEAQGWLRLTSAQTGEFGYAYDNEAFPSTAGVLVEFEYADWGGTGADGLTFFLFNGATSESEFHAGQPGGSLGYASCSPKGSGLTNAYVGVGFDEYGNFTNLGVTCGLDGSEFLPDHVSVRGSAGEAYKLLTTAATSESLRAERPQARHVTIAITPADELSVYIRYPDGTYQKISEGFQLPIAPEKLKFGYVASTGALTDNHEIRNALVLEPTELTPSVAQTAGGQERGKPITWTAVVRNEGPNPTQRERVRASTGEQTLSAVSWTCEAAGGAECAIAAGSGLPSPEAGPMPAASTLTYKITGTPTASTDYAQMTVESEPRGATGELDPELESATARTNLTPLFQKAPSFTLNASGEATATAVPALGGEVSYSYTWQRCELGTATCTDIPGAESTSYQTTAADRGHTLRFAETATNSAGSATATSAAYKGLPTVAITSAPAHFSSSREAKIAFAASTKEATLECSLDGEAWSPCTSPMSYAGLLDGAHIFSVRAVYGGLSQPDPPTAEWSVEATSPATPTILSGPSSPTSQTVATFKFSNLTAADTLECRLDGGKWKPCQATSNFTALTKGEHHLEARQVNRAGLDSSVVSYTWTVGTAPTPPTPPTPPATKPPATSTQSAPHGATGEPAAKTAKPPHRARRKKKPKGRRPKSKSRPKGRRRRSSRGTGRPSATPPHTSRAGKPASTPRPNSEGSSTDSAATSQPGAHQPGTKTVPTTKTSSPAQSTASNGARSPHTTSRPKTGSSRPDATPRPPSKAPSSGGRRRSRSGAPEPATGQTTGSGSTQQHTAAHRRTPAESAKPRGAPRPGRSSPTPGATRKSSEGARAPSSGSSDTGSRSAPPAPRDHGVSPTSGRRGVPDGIQSGPGNPVIWPFGPRSSALTHGAVEVLKRVVASLARASRVVCVGYTDSLGTQAYNRALGLKRARAVCGELRALGVRASLGSETRGAEDPRASNATARGRALNRRVELRISY